MLRQAVKAARKQPTVKTVALAYSRIDRAAKKGVIHKNKAARLKSKLTPKTKAKVKVVEKKQVVKKRSTSSARRRTSRGKLKE